MDELHELNSDAEQDVTYQLALSDDIAISILVKEVSEQKGMLNYFGKSKNFHQCISIKQIVQPA